MPKGLQIDEKAENGHWNCERFVSQAGANEEEKEKGGCTNCEYFKTKSKQWKETNRRFEKIYADAEYYRRLRDSRFWNEANAVHSIPCEVFDVMMITDSLEKQFRDSQDFELAKSLQMLGQRLKLF